MKAITKKKNLGFTLMEIVVSTTIFAIVAAAMMSLFNYVLKINRRSEALRQSAQGLRNFVEILAKDIRNGQIDYFVINGTTQSPVAPLGPCAAPAINGNDIDQTYQEKENKVGVMDSEGRESCYYFGDANGNPLSSGTFVAPNGKGTLVLLRVGSEKQILNPPNGWVEKFALFIRPLCDPYASSCTDYSNTLARIQPMVQMNILFRITLPTGESVPILYQTTISTNKYDIPNQ
jgi:prepilin-type N-terminal cleavage/methylation domain-containing protein